MSSIPLSKRNTCPSRSKPWGLANHSLWSCREGGLSGRHEPGIGPHTCLAWAQEREGGEEEIRCPCILPCCVYSVPATQSTLQTCPQGIYKSRWEREKQDRPSSQWGAAALADGRWAQGRALGVIFKWGLLRAKKRTEQKGPRANCKYPLLGIYCPQKTETTLNFHPEPWLMEEVGGRGPCEDRVSQWSTHPPAWLYSSLTKSPMRISRYCPRLSPSLSPWAQISPEQLTGSRPWPLLSGCVVPEATNTCHLQFKDLWLSWIWSSSPTFLSGSHSRNHSLSSRSSFPTPAPSHGSQIRHLS